MKQLNPKAVWLFFIGFILRWSIILIIVGFWLFSLIIGLTNENGELSLLALNWLWLIIPAFFLLFLFFWVWAKFTYHFYKYELIETGFRKESGVIYKKYVTIPYDRIQNVDIYRGIWARILGLSDLHIQTAGASATVGRYGLMGAGAEGRLPGLSYDVAEELRDEVIERARRSKNQGL
ncbi:MAG: PH domain-containing protein [Patescibacteria group bacterium]